MTTSIPALVVAQGTEAVHVLLVEDNPGDVLLITEALREAGIELLTARRLDDALRVLRTDGVDIVLLDLGLPDSQGIDTLGSVLAATRQPVIVLTGLDDERTGLEAVRLGAEDYLVKGRVDAASLARSVRFGVERSRLRAALAAPLLESAHVGLAVLDAGLRFVYANPAVALITGVPAALHLGRAAADLIPELGDAETGLLSGVLQGAPVRDVEVALGSPSSVTLLVSAEPMRDARGAVVGATLSIADISERRRREEAVASLAESRSHTHAIGELIPYGIWIADGNRRIRYLSPSFLELIGMDMAEAAGDGWMAAIDEPDRERVADAWERAASTSALEAEYSVIGADHRLHTILTRGYAVAEPGSPATSWAGINLDITERKEGERLREALVGVLSHELRTPVTSIYAAIRVLLRGDVPEATQRELLSDMEAESDRLRRLIEDLLILARAEHGVHVDEEPVLLQHLVPRVAADVQRRWPLAKVEVIAEDGLPVAAGDEARVEQVLHNLLSNAAKYAGSGGPITVRVTSEDGCVVVRVIDSGPGIDPDEVGHLFDLFYRSPGLSLAASGSGIGLFVVRQLVQSMRGEVWAANRDDGHTGAEFGFRLQVLADDEA